MGTVRVHHCVLNRSTRQYGPNPTSDLLGVDYYLTVPADTEFPRTLGQLELFVRFFTAGKVAGRGRITVTHLNSDGTDRQQVFRKLFYLPQSGADSTGVSDKAYKLVRVVLPGVGTYAVRVARRTRRRWDDRRRWRILATEYFFVVRAA